MFKRLDVTEFIFKVIAYSLLTVFALFCLYPFVYAISSAISGKEAVNFGQVILLPIDPQFKAFLEVFQDREFWLCYANTLFLTLMGTIFSMLKLIIFFS